MVASATPTTNGLPTTAVSNSGTGYIDALIGGVKWGGNLGSGIGISFSFPVGTASWAANYSLENEPNSWTALDATEAAAARLALQAWANVANISFAEVTDSSSQVGDIRFAYSNTLIGTGAAAWAYYPGGNVAAGDVWLNPENTGVTPGEFDEGRYDFQTLLHELGHALGLTHPGDVSDNPAYTKQYSLMSYNDHPNALFREVIETAPGSYSFNYFYVQPSTPMLNDIAAIQYLYGANMTYKTGDDVYTFDPDTPFFSTLWDAGGKDTISLSNFIKGSVIDLRAGGFSSITIESDPLPPGYSGGSIPTYYGQNNLAVAYGVTIENATGGEGGDTIIGNASANLLKGNGGADSLTGGLGADVLNGGTGNDALIGGDGSDIYYVDSASDSVTETNATASVGGTDAVYSYLISYTLGSNVENGRILATGASNLTGNSLNNVLYAGAGNNALDGSTGVDTAAYSFAGSAVAVSLVAPGAQVTGGSGSDTLSAIENLTGSNYNDTLTGNAVNNVLNGGAGNDTLVGGLGNDTYFINTLSDVVTELAGQGADLVQSAISYSLADSDGVGTSGGNVENLRLTGTGNIDGTGNLLNNVIFASAGNNVINGGAGTDSASYLYAGSAVTVSLAVTMSQVTGGSGSDTLTTIENLTGSNYNDTLTGDGSNNTLSGGSGNDTLSAGDGNDALYGGLGNDILTGGNGSDSFIFNATLNASTNKDTITDFVSGSDKIKLDDAVCTAVGMLGHFATNDDRFYAAAGAVAGHDDTDRIIYNADTGALYYDADGSGTGVSIQIALLGIASHPGLAATDCVVV